MTRLPLLLAVLAASGAAVAQEVDRPPFELRQPRSGDGPLSVYERLLDAKPRYDDAPQSLSWIRQVLALEAAELGRHAEALRWADSTLSPSYALDAESDLPADAQALDAVDEIARRAEDARIVMVNEAHHDASTRLLTLALLEPLYERGYRYLAAETFTPDSVLRRQPPYPTPDTGYYLDEPVFGALVREALRLGYTLVPYEVEDRVKPDSLTFQQHRDRSQAVHLKERIFDRDPDARVLVHAGYAHVNEAYSESFTPMGWYFRGLTGLDPLTVEQTHIGPTSDARFEHPRYRAADTRGLLDGVRILAEADGTPLEPVGRGSTDLQVVRPRLERPVEAIPGYGQVRTWAAPLSCAPCVADARRMDEGADAVPVDRQVVEAGVPVALAGPTDVPLVVTVRDGRTGREVARRVAVAR